MITATKARTMNDGFKSPTDKAMERIEAEIMKVVKTQYSTTVVFHRDIPDVLRYRITKTLKNLRYKCEWEATPDEYIYLLKIDWGP
jgi:hypothetical protein